MIIAFLCFLLGIMGIAYKMHKNDLEVKRLKLEKEILELEVKKQDNQIKILEEDNKKLDKMIDNVWDNIK